MGEWLFDILKEGEIKDNRIYKASNGVLTGLSRKSPITLNHKEKYRRNPWQKEWEIWNFLLDTSLETEEALNDSSSVYFMKEMLYEHNSDDKFFNIKGKNARNFILSTGNIVGYVRKREYSIKISSRFGDDFLKYIISDADGFLKVKDFGGEEKDDKGFEWLLTYLWKIKLKSAFRLGLPKTYVSKKENTTRLKGQIDPVNFYLGNNGKYSCTYREHSYINEAVAIIDAAFDKLRGKTILFDMHPIKLAFKTALEGRKYKRRELYKVQNFTNPFYTEYNEVIDLSKQILKDDFSSFGEKSDASAFLFDVSMLFEYFIHKLLLRNGFKVESKSKQHKVPSGISTRNLEPDIVFEDEGDSYVFDVKYKYFNWHQKGVSREDLFQLHTYIGQFGNSRNIKGCGFIFPLSQENFEANVKQEFLKQEMQVMGKIIPFYIIFLTIPKSGTEEYPKIMSENCKLFIKRMKKIIRKDQEIPLRKVI